MKIAVFGGSFNPIHIGHLALADSVCKEAGYDKVIFVPTANPPHKEMAKGSASAEDRFSMVSYVSEL
ncbi:MAG: adenylyltransferase/cytidyltransferase family protein, partial [Treponema sp.]|nr:adenylyltransferase/cytidyltransferase family protein [Treponema sp.]